MVMIMIIIIMTMIMIIDITIVLITITLSSTVGKHNSSCCGCYGSRRQVVQIEGCGDKSELSVPPQVVSPVTIR